MDFRIAFLVFVGGFSIVGALFDWDWFMTHRRARFLTKIVRSRRNARIFYVVLGLLFIAMAGMEAFGVGS